MPVIVGDHEKLASVPATKISPVQSGMTNSRAQTKHSTHHLVNHGARASNATRAYTKTLFAHPARVHVILLLKALADFELLHQLLLRDDYK
jgi:hypothetical protein